MKDVLELLESVTSGLLEDEQEARELQEEVTKRRAALTGILASGCTADKIEQYIRDYDLEEEEVSADGNCA